MEPIFITNEPMLIVGDRLTVADLHIGIDHEYWKAGIKISPYLEKIMPKLEKLIKESNAKKLMILGDVKHMVPGLSWQEIKEIPSFFRYFKKIVDIEIVPGNHDGLLEKYSIKGIKIYPRSGVLIDDVYYTHGHTWPSADFLKAKYLIMGHIHPGIEFKSELGYRWVEDVWVRAEFDSKKIKEKYGSAENLPEVIILPKFNDYVGTVALNKPMPEIEKQYYESPGPIMKNLRLDEAKIYMLDGTFLGELKNLRNYFN